MLTDRRSWRVNFLVVAVLQVPRKSSTIHDRQQWLPPNPLAWILIATLPSHHSILTKPAFAIPHFLYIVHPDSIELSIMMEPNHHNKPCILWSAVSRNDVVLAEANDPTFPWEDCVRETALQLLQKPPTPGWEFVTYHPQRIRSPVDHPPSPKLKGMKFHIYEHNNDGMHIWKVSAVYDPSAVENVQVQSFIQKIITISEVFREADPAWKYGSALAAQKTFAPILLQRMEEISYLGKLAMVNDQIESLKQVMANNIELILERGERLEQLHEESTHLSQMAAIFKKRSTQVKRQMLWQNAKHGLLLGSAITAGVAVVVVPPIVAAL